MFQIVFRDSSLYPKQLSVFCLLWLISACANSMCYLTKLCSMTELLHDLKKTVVDIEAFMDLVVSQ